MVSVEGLSMRAAADRLGVSVATVCYHVAYIRRLPEQFVVWLESDASDPFHEILIERRLREIVKLCGEKKTTAISDLLLACKSAANEPQIQFLDDLIDTV